ncbi:MAG: hypothetical protein QOH76_3241 [Thermoleophilaceae bacterium]|nr:hypothetical protein [Thermoleophilaceae bacterium]
MRASITASSGQDPRFGDLHEALVDAMALAGVPAEVSVDCFAAAGDGLVHVLVPGAYLPHVHPAAYPSADQLRRTLLVVTDSPGAPGFDRSAALAETAAATFVLDPGAVPELARKGIRARLLPLGHVPAWDIWGGAESERPIDLAVLGDFSDRRARAVALAGPALAGRRAALHLVRKPLTPATAAATPSGAAKRELLANARVLLLVHEREGRSFDWLEALPAIANGVVILSEQPSDHGPLAAGRHFECAGFYALSTALEGLLASPDRLERVRSEAYDFIRAERPLSAVGAALREAIDSTSAAAGHASGARGRLTVPMPLQAEGPTPAVERLQEHPSEGDVVRAALKQALVRQRRLERELRRLDADGDGAGPDDRVVEIGSSDAPQPRVSVVVTLYNYANTIAGALRSVGLSDLDEVEVVLVDDASTDDSLAVARAALEEMSWLPGRIVERGANGGLPAARNAGIAHARADYVFVLDADNVVHPGGLRLLADALDREPGADFAYGVIRQVGPAGPMGLLSWAPWDPWWLRIDNYIDAMAMLRRSSVEVVGGYTSDEAFMGWEDFELWCNMASHGMSGEFVPELVADYRTGHISMLSLTTLDTTDGWTALFDRYEFLREPA